MNCWHCQTELIWGGDHDMEDNEDYDIITNLSCPKCYCIVDVYHPSEKLLKEYKESDKDKERIKKIRRPYDPHSEKQHEFIAGSGNLCKRYWDESKEGLRTANAPWTIEVRK